jgi:beta-lactamase class C
MWTKIWIFLLIAIIIGTCKSSDYIENEELPSDIKPVIKYAFVNDFVNYVNQNINDSATPGAAVALVKDDSIILCKGFGVKQVGTNDSIKEHTIFRIASVSKGFASVLAGIMVQEGKLNWDDKVLKYLPDFELKDKKNTEQLSVRHILSQTTGLPKHTYTDMIECNVGYEKLRNKLRDVSLAAPVGTIYSYQNVIYSVIGEILEKISGKDYETLMKEKVFLPLGMLDASASFNEFEQSSDHAYPHIRTRKGIIQTKNTPEYYSYLPAAGVNASINDMAKWMLALMGHRPDILSQGTLKEIFTPQVESTRRRSYHFAKWMKVNSTFYGLGWRILSFGSDTLIYHGGFINGYRCEVAFDLNDKVGITILSNGPGAFVNNAVPYFFNLYYESRDKNSTKKAGNVPLCFDDL